MNLATTWSLLAPRLGLTVWDRAVYSYLLRHSLVVGRLRLHFAVLSVARDLGLSNGPVRQAVRRLDELGALDRPHFALSVLDVHTNLRNGGVAARYISTPAGGAPST